MADQQVQVPPTDEKRALLTDYVVLKQVSMTDQRPDQHDSGWTEIGPAEGVNAQAAIKAVAQGEGTFVAIPARSWKPLTRKVEKVERDIWS